MSHKLSIQDTQPGSSRRKNVTVSRAAKSYSSKHEPNSSESARLRPALGSSPVIADASGIHQLKPAPRPQILPRGVIAKTPMPNTVGLSSPKYAGGLETSTMTSTSGFQEVPLLIDTAYQSYQPRVGHSTSRRVARPTDESEPSSPFDAQEDAIFGIVMPQSRTGPRNVELPPRLIPELQALAAGTAPSRAQDTTAARSVGSISSPSTRLSSSTSPWSASTTRTTPTSWSSTSPGIVHPPQMRQSGHRSQTVPVPASKRQKLPKLPALPKDISSVPSLSAATVAADKEFSRTPSKKQTPFNTPAPTPPPRTSSAKRSLSRSSSKGEAQPDHPSLAAPTSSGLGSSPNVPLGRTATTDAGKSLRENYLARAHEDLQQSLNDIPQRPSREGTANLGESRPIVFNNHRSGFTTLHRELLSDGEVRGRREANPRSDLSTSHATKIPIQGDPSTQRSPSRLGKFSRLGIFGRRSKSPTSGTERSPRKLQRKGPVAGTGHEGYGRYGRRGRKTSQETSSVNSETERSVSSTRRTPIFSSSRKGSFSSSRHDRSSQSDLDDFAATRLKPVVMVGGSGNSHKGTFANRIDLQENPLPTPVLNKEFLGQWNSPVQSQSSIGQYSLRDSPGRVVSETEDTPQVPRLALRRSQKFGTEAETFSLPTPLRTEELGASTYPNSHDTGRSLSTPSTSNEPGSAQGKSTEKKSRKLRWNLFRRKESISESTRPTPVGTTAPEEMSVSITAYAAARPMPYYAMMDSESEVNANEQLGTFRPQVDSSSNISALVEFEESFIVTKPRQEHYEGEDEGEGDAALPPSQLSPVSSVTRSPPAVKTRTSFEPQLPPKIEPAPRQPRLVRVGRIPPVISRTEREHTPSRSSFSQPFARTQVDSESTSIGLEPHSEDLVPLHVSSDLLPSRPFPVVEPEKTGNALPFREPEFLQFPSRQPSEVTTSSSSEGVVNILGPALILSQSPTQYATLLGNQDQFTTPLSPNIDDIWNEYDDFIDHVMSPSRARKSVKAATKNALVIPEDAEAPSYPPHVGSYGRLIQQDSREGMASDISVPAMKRPIQGLSIATSVTPPVIFAPSTMPERNVAEEIRLRRSRIVSALHSSIDPASPFSMREFLTEYETYPRNSAKWSERFSSSTAGRSHEGLTATAGADYRGEPSHQENVALLDVVERSKDPVAQSELHFASLMVSKWLSFGRILFSPAHDEINTISERHILVIDGLGDEDWSIYCAVAYEAQRAFVHDLKERKKGSKLPKSAQSTPDNHRRAEVASFYERFPFPAAFFSAVVLRFPPAMAEAKLKNIISECRRVLLPGGYLEMMLLDLDIVNMGVQTRRAVRELKFKMTTADKQISLRPIIDNVQGILGGRGFSNISRCVVGVPVAGRPSGTGDSSNSSRSSRGSDGNSKRGSADGRQANASPRMKIGAGRKGASLSLNDLIEDHSDNADAKIGRIVSRTARTWWQHCFEASVISDGNLSRSIFADKHVLGECKSRGSSFKMLIAYAQRPVFETRRRTMSEPVVATLATAGAQKSPHASGSGSRTA